MLDPQLQQLLAFARDSGAPDLADLPPPAARDFYRQLLAATDLTDVADVQVHDLHIDAGGHPLPLRVYTPRGERNAPRGLVVYTHGGGFVVGDLDCYDRVLRRISLDSDCVIVSVDYRLAPEHPFPAAVLDAQAALRWAVAEATSLGADPARIAVVGDSAGANLAAVSALWARDAGVALAYQVLVYPVTAASGEGFASYAKYGEGYVLSQRAVDYFMAFYFGPSQHAPDWRGAPLTAPSLKGVAPALVLVAGHDVLRDEGIAYAERLCAEGVQATLVEYAGLAHGFISMGGALTAARLAVDQISAALRLALQP